MLGTTVKVRGKSWVVINGILAVAVIVALAPACHRKLPLPSPTPTQFQPLPDAQPALDPTFLVLALMESIPPGARIVRVSDGHVLGYTPEIIEFHQSNQLVAVRLELEGYLPLTREVRADADSELAVVLEAAPRDRARATKKSERLRNPRN
jgi:hypothetical protein